MKRRDFLKTGSFLGGMALAGPDLLQSTFNTKKKPKKVLILGSGFAGLAAAYALKKKGIKYQILEARNRIGGRVYSFKPNPELNLTIELGAEWVGESHVRIIELCKEFGLILDNNQFDTHLSFEGSYFKAGGWNLSPELEKFWNSKTTLWNALTPVQKRKLDKQDWWRYLSNKGFSDRDLLLRELADSTDFGESIRHTSAYAAFAEYAESSEKNEMDYKIRGGNGLLAEKLADAVGREFILTQHKAVQINQDANGVKVICENGQSFSADRLICTVPLYALQKIKWNPGLPSYQLDAINSLQYARIGKFPMVFKERFWKEENFDMITDTPTHYFYHATKNQAGPSGVLISYAIGEKADSLASVTKQQREDLILNALKPAFGDVRKYLSESLMYYWGVDNYSKGAYAFYGKGQWFGTMPILKQAHLNTHFAGEHLADWQGFMEGAINSGEEAAEGM
ncbi:MAG: FAD-dependent oxidoreductase [Saprospiraceae bacterium]|nr:FAD-dependent oxidoreductase [Saprospiraceae bacterium]MBK8298013.1 FAD-dependent oxidoreductase [Saprospiraceae bacterium]